VGHVEYRIEKVQLQDEVESRLDQMVDRLNELAKDGWRAVSVDLTVHSSFETRALPVLLERDVPEPAAPQQQEQPVPTLAAAHA
jgi:hypothetical protein